MTVIASSVKRGGFLLPLPSSSGVSPVAERVAAMLNDAWSVLAESLAVARTAEVAISELKRARQVAMRPNWDGYNARALDSDAYDQALQFLQALPTTMPPPDVSVDPDGEVDVLWQVGTDWTFSISIGRKGRLTYSGLFGNVQSYGTEWFANEIPQAILFNMSRVVSEGRR